LNLVCRFDNHSASFTLRAFSIHNFKNFRPVSFSSISFWLINCKKVNGQFTFCWPRTFYKV
jgi:hypothetical protein